MTETSEKLDTTQLMERKAKLDGEMGWCRKVCDIQPKLQPTWYRAGR